MISRSSPVSRLDAVEELLAVVGRAAGFGGDQPRAPDRAAGELVGADLQRLDGAVHGRLAEAAARRQPLAQPDDARERVDDAELAGPRRHGDQQPAIVGAEVERGEDRLLVRLRARPRTAGAAAGSLRVDPVVLDCRRAGRRRACRRWRRQQARRGQRRCAATPSRAKTLRPRLRLRRFLVARPVVGSVARFLVRARRRPERGRHDRRCSGIGRQEVGRRTAGRRTASVGVLHLLFLHAPREPCRTLHALRSSLLPSRLAATATFTKWRGRFSFPGKPLARRGTAGNGRKGFPCRPRYGYPTTGKRF